MYPLRTQFLPSSDLESLVAFDASMKFLPSAVPHEFQCQPGDTSASIFQPQPFAAQILIVDLSDFQLAGGRRLTRVLFRCRVVIEVKVPVTAQSDLGDAAVFPR